MAKKAEKLKKSNNIKHRVEAVMLEKKMLCMVYSCEDLYFKDVMRARLKEISGW